MRDLARRGDLPGILHCRIIFAGRNGWFIFALRSALSTSLLQWRLYLAESSLSLSMKGSWARTLDPELEYEELNNVVNVVIMSSSCSVRACTLRLNCVTGNQALHSDLDIGL